MTNRTWWWLGLGVALLVAVVSPLASSHPDGLERVAEDQAFLDAAREPPFRVIADYAFPGIENEALATMLAGIVGTMVVFALLYGLGRVLARRRHVSA